MQPLPPEAPARLGRVWEALRTVPPSALGSEMYRLLRNLIGAVGVLWTGFALVMVARVGGAVLPRPGRAASPGADR